MIGDGVAGEGSSYAVVLPTYFYTLTFVNLTSFGYSEERMHRGTQET